MSWVQLRLGKGSELEFFCLPILTSSLGSLEAFNPKSYR
jgi:hypothetical protein